MSTSCRRRLLRPRPGRGGEARGRRARDAVLVARTPVAIALALAFAAVACATEPDAPVEHRQGAIVGGQLAGTCQWASVVSFGGCDGVLLSPRVFATAAHCLRAGAPAAVIAGETQATPARSYTVESCRLHPDHDDIVGADVAFCTLAEAADVPIVPAAAPCEAEALARAGAEVTLVGFGDVAEGQSGEGHKRWVTTQVRGTQAGGRELVVGTALAGACDGDSGGPAFSRAPDGSWRVVGLVSRVGPNLDGVDGADLCASTTAYSALAAHVEWIEAESGTRVTACGPAGDTPADAGGACREIPAHPEVAGGAWATACVQPAAAPAATCQTQDATAGGCAIGGAGAERPRSPVAPTLAILSALAAVLARRRADRRGTAGRD